LPVPIPVAVAIPISISISIAIPMSVSIRWRPRNQHDIGSHPHMGQRHQLARRRVSDGCDSITVGKTGSACWANDVSLQIGTDVAETHRRAFSLFLLGGPLLNRAFELPQIIDARTPVRRGPGLDVVGNRD